MFQRIIITLSVIHAVVVSRGFGQDEFAVDSIITLMRRVAQYRMTYSDIGHLYNNPQANKGDQPNPWNGSYADNPGNNWDVGAFMTGLMALYYTTRDTTCLDFAKEWAEFFNWSPFNGYTSPNNMTTNADHLCCGQTYCEIYMLDPQPSNEYMITPVGNNLKNMFDVVKPSPRILYGTWGWCDALYMAPPTIARYCEAVGDDRLLDSLNRWWDDITDFLYDDTYKFFYRDASYIYPARQSINGTPMFWAPGQAWVLAGLVRVIEYLPSDYQHRDKFIAQFQEMSAAIIARQGYDAQYDGLWTTNMLDQENYPDPETSGSAFFCFAFLWGVRNGLLDSATYIPAANIAWRDLVKNIGADGRLLRCQHVDEAPRTDLSGDINNSSPEGEGAFLLSGLEMILRVQDPLRTAPKGRVSAVQPSPLTLFARGIALNKGYSPQATLRIYSPSGKVVGNLTPRLNGSGGEAFFYSWHESALAGGTYFVRYEDGLMQRTAPFITFSY